MHWQSQSTVTISSKATAPARDKPGPAAAAKLSGPGLLSSRIAGFALSDRPELQVLLFYRAETARITAPTRPIVAERRTAMRPPLGSAPTGARAHGTRISAVCVGRY